MIIGISGYARAGKDTIAAALVEQGFTLVRFSDPLKKMMLALNPLIAPGLRYAEVVTASGVEGAKHYPEVRRLMQHLGTECVRTYLGQDAWVDALERTLDGGVDYVVPDVRFLNEAELIRRRCGLVWRVNRPGVDAANQHISDTQLDDYKFDTVFSNTGTVKDLHTLALTHLHLIAA